MKRIFKKNQVIITSLVIMIIVAGYLNFTADQSTTAVSDNQELTNVNAGDISEEDLAVDVEVNPEEDMADLDIENQNDENGQSEAMDGESGEDASGGQQAMTENDDDIDDVNTIGEAVLTSTAAKNFSAAAKLNREQTRSQTKETLMDIINNAEADESIRQEAMDNLMKITNASECELAAETLLEAKGYSNSVVSINDESVDVVICLESLTETQKAQIEDIVKRKAGVEADKIVITLLK
ncbi:MAG: SpoIIIAH-like family protein [Lachnospiraceae bacterium]|nr:SpoIIIAH-like family protein [Lachnospiraceae bacterium]